MAWTYDTELSTDKDKVRLYIGDTLSNIPLLSNEEIEAELSLNEDDVFRTVESLCRALSARLGREAVVEIKDVLKDEKQAQAKHFLLLAEKYANRTAMGSTSIGWSGTFDSTTDDPFFTRGLHNE